MDNTPFNHGFTVDSMRAPQGHEVLGYNKAMIEIQLYLQKVTEFKPEKRFIDAVPLLEKISATLGQLTAIYEKSKKEDEEKVSILSGTKKDQEIK